jgi:hypothetical protein
MTSPGKSRWLAAAMVGGTLIGGPGLALAAPFDGATPLLCAVQTVMECERSGQCVRVTTDEVDLPALLRVDVPKKMISAAMAPSEPPRSDRPRTSTGSSCCRAGSTVAAGASSSWKPRAGCRQPWSILTRPSQSSARVRC